MNRLFSEEEIYEKFRPYVSKGILVEIIEEMTETKAVIIPDDATNGSVFETVFDIEDKEELYLETANVDAEVADIIIQYAIFNEIVFG